MDFVIRRQSEKIDSNYNEDLNNSAEDDYDYRKWEWGYLRVRIVVIRFNQFRSFYIIGKHTDRMRKSISGNVLQHVRSTVTKKLSVDISSDSHPGRYRAHCRAGGITIGRSNTFYIENIYT